MAGSLAKYGNTCELQNRVTNVYRTGGRGKTVNSTTRNVRIFLDVMTKAVAPRSQLLGKAYWGTVDIDSAKFVLEIKWPQSGGMIVVNDLINNNGRRGREEERRL